MKRYILIVSVVLLGWELEAQQLSGFVQEQDSQHPVSHALVSLKNERGEVLKQEVADEEGFFQMPVKKGAYIEVSLVDYQSRIIPLKDVNPSVILKVNLKQAAASLGGVTVIARRKIISPSVDKKEVHHY